MSLCLEAGGGAPRGRTVVALEGGYHLDATASSAAAQVSVMLGEPAPAVAPASGDGIDRLVGALSLAHPKQWPLLGT